MVSLRLVWKLIIIITECYYYIWTSVCSWGRRDPSLQHGHQYHLAQASARGCNKRLRQNSAPHAGVALSVSVVLYYMLSSHDVPMRVAMLLHSNS